MRIASVDDMLAGIFHVVGVDAHGCVAHDGLGACCGHHSIVALVVAVQDVAFVFLGHVVLLYHAIFQVVELAVLVFVHHLLVAQGSEGLGVPVHHAHTAVESWMSLES